MKRLWLLLLLVAAAAGCSKPASNLMLQFAESEKDIQPYMTRTIITPHYMRFDSNKDDGDFILFDRKTRIIYSVVHSDRTVLVIKPRKITVKSPIKLDFKIQQGTLGKEVPKVDGKEPAYYRYLANGKVCYQSISVKGLFPDASKAFHSYLQTLAGEHARILPRTPADQQNACDLAANVYDYGSLYDYGFPINEWHGDYRNDYKRQMVNYVRDFKADPKLFELPKDFRRYTPEQMSGA